ncbi:MAG: response regulator [Deltaproteobacteria bacterium]|nr:response regulator [Deltaproteobacteria bacterium]
MSLRRKILMGLIITWSLLAFFIYWIPSKIVESSFLQLEQEDVVDKGAQARDALLNEIENLKTKTMDWAAWDDTYQFVQDRNKAYIKSNLNEESINSLRLNYLVIANSQNKIVASRAVSSTGPQLEKFPEELLAHLKPDSELFKHENMQSSKAGFITLSDGAVLFASLPIITSRRTGPSRGTLIFARRLDQQKVSRLAGVTHLDLQFFLTNDYSVKKIFDENQKAFLAEQTIVKPLSEKQVIGYSMMKDFYGKPGLVLSTEIPRDTYQQGRRTLLLLIASLLIAALVTGAVVLALVQKLVLIRLLSLNVEVKKIGRRTDLSVRMPEMGEDELGGLSKTINEMLSMLQISQLELQATSDMLRESNSRLEEKIRESEKLNSDLSQTQDQLLQAQKMESIGKLAGGIAHDFNNLLGSILGYASILEDDLKNNMAAKKPLDVIQKSAKRAAELTKQLLSFARKGNYNKKQINLNEVVLEAQSLLSSSLPRTISVRSELSKDIPLIEGDAGQILQVLMNMGVNSGQAMPKGGQLLFETQAIIADKKFCEAQLGLQPGRYVRIRTTDTGIGMSKEIQSRIFEPFFTTKEVGEGTGLGLAMVHGIMKSHAGTVTVYSEPNVGAVFHLYFPEMRANGEIEISPFGSDVTKIKLTQESLAGRTVLIVDDEEMMRNVATDILTGVGAKTLVAKNGEEALHLFKAHQHSIDLIISDVIMPRVSGIQLVQAIREMNSNVPVILSSGYAENNEISDLRRSSNLKFIQKPYRRDEILWLVWDALKSQFAKSIAKV